MAEEILRVVCGWCGRVLEVGTPGAPTSHGMCQGCAKKFERS